MKIGIEDPIQTPMQFAVGDLIVDAGTHQVMIGGREIVLPKLTFQLLLALVRAAPDMLTTDQLIAIVWSGRIVSNETVTQRVKLLRQAIGDDATSPRYIGVVRGEGYRLLLEAHPLVRESKDAAQKNSAEKSRSRRHATTLALGLLGSVLAVAIGWWLLAPAREGGSSGQQMSPRIAVLPFLNLSTDVDNDAFVDGLTDEIIGELSRSPNLRVAGRTSSFAFKNRNPTFAELGEALNVSEVLEGSVRWDDDSLRITVQLISAADGFHLWSETYVRPLEDLYSVQQDIARGVSTALRVAPGAAPLPVYGTSNGRAYGHFLRGQTLFWNHTAESNERAISAYLDALELDPTFVRAWIGLGYAYGARSREVGFTADALDDMERAAQRASRMAPDYWEAQALTAWVQMSKHAFVDAERSMARTIALRARDNILIEHISCPITCYFQQVGRLSDALAEATAAHEYDPLSPSAEIWNWLYLLGRREEAINAFREAESLGIPPSSRQQFEHWIDMEDPDPEAMNKYLTGTPLEGKWGDPDQFLPVLEGAANPDAPLRRGVRAGLALYAAIHGDDGLALRLLRAEFLQPGFGGYFVIWHPALRTLRTSDGFSQFLTELGLVDAWRQTGNWGDFCSQSLEGRLTCR